MANEYDPTAETMEWGTEEEELKKLQFEPIPAGEYDMQLESIEFRTSSKKGTPGLNFTFKVIGVEGRDNVKQFHWCGWNTAFLRSTCVALMRGEVTRLREGFTLPGVMNGDFGPLGEYIGAPVRAYVKVDHYKDESTGDEVVNNKISKFIYK